MKSPSIPSGLFPTHRPLRIPVSSAALWICVGLHALHAQTTGGNNIPPRKDIYEYREITAAPNGTKPLPIKLETYLNWKKNVKGDPETEPDVTDINWSADKGEPEFDPTSGASVELDFAKPFVKENTAAAKKVTVTATYSGSASVEGEPPTKDVERIYLDFWIAETKESEDDALIVRAEDAQPTEDDKKVIHWAKVVVKHSASEALPLQLESSGEKPLYFYGEEQNPNQLTADPSLTGTLEKEFSTGQWFWIGTDAKGTGQAKFKAKGDAGTGYKDAQEEKTVDLLPVDLDVNGDGDLSDPCDGLATYMPGYELSTAKLHTGTSFENSQYAGPQSMNIIIDNLPSSMADEAHIRIVAASNWFGYCGNGNIHGESQFSPYWDFTLTGKQTNAPIQEQEVTVAIAGNKMIIPIYCHDYGGWCEVEITLKKDGAAIGSPIKLTLPHDGNGDRLADHWQDTEITAWNTQFGTSRPLEDAERDKMKPGSGYDLSDYADDEMKKSDGASGSMPEMADEGDGLKVIEEYRGFILDGGPGVTDPGHFRLSVARKELLVECSEEQGIVSPTNLGQNANTVANQYTLKSLMGSVSEFYNGPNGADIDLYWCRDEFIRGDMVNYDATWSPQDHLAYFKDTVPLTYPLTTPPQPPVTGYANIHHDYYLFHDDRPQHDERYGNQYRGLRHMALVNRNELLRQFVKLNILTRNGVILNTPDIVRIETNSNHAFNYAASGTPDPLYQGYFIFVNGIAEEGRFSDPPALYGEAQFAGALAWATAHELSHMIGVADSATPGSLMGSTTGTVIDDVSFINSEIEQINLCSRLSVEN